MLRISIAVALALSAPVLCQAQPAKPDPQKGSAIVQGVCVACHGADGNSPTPANPSLASQHADYLHKQLIDFKVAEGATAAERPSAIMTPFASQLSDADMRNVAAYFESQVLKPSAAMHKEWVQTGQQIYRAGIAEKNVPACAGCHGPEGAGIPAEFPRLQGQYADYTGSQLVAFREGTRANSPQMAAIAARLSDSEIKAVSVYIAGLR
jgi:cbb3-type cytochrome c oxidase subunit III